MRKLITAALIAASLTATHPGIAQAQDTSKWRGPCDGKINGEYDTGATPKGVVHFHTRHLVICVFDLLSPTQTSMALMVANRESGFTPTAYNPSGCSGVFQHQASLWTGRTILLPRSWLSPYLWTRWSYNGGPATVSPFNAYANVIVTAIMTHTGNWGPWGMG